MTVYPPIWVSEEAGVVSKVISWEVFPTQFTFCVCVNVYLCVCFSGERKKNGGGEDVGGRGS